MKEKPMVSRRTFLESAGVATGAVVAAGAFPHPAVGKVKGANERINIAILGPGGRAQEHIRILNHLKDENKGVDIIGLCDVWDGGSGWKTAGRRPGPLLLRREDAASTPRARTRTAITKDYRRSSSARTSTPS